MERTAALRSRTRVLPRVGACRYLQAGTSNNVSITHGYQAHESIVRTLFLQQWAGTTPV